MAADRTDFLLKMYDQMFNDINTHILVVWQSIAVVVGAFAVFALVEKKVISADLAVALIIMLCGWLIAHLYDASYWYNRNLVIIANIERQFLKQEDLKSIHYYFGKHRSSSAMLTHLRVQYWLGVGIGMLFLIFHFVTRVVPGIHEPWTNFDPLRALPYIVLISCIIFLNIIRRNRKNSYLEFIKNSPGVDINTLGIAYGVGHPVEIAQQPKAEPSTDNGETAAGATNK